MSKRNCVDCKFWSWHAGDGPYSELTPGTDWSSSCGQRHWEMSGTDVSEATFRDNMRRARNCNDYTERPSKVPTIADFGFTREILVRRGSAWSTMAIEVCTEEAMQGVDEWKRIGP